MPHSYYKRILGFCLALVFVLLIVHTAVSFVLLRNQTMRHSSALSEKILSDLTVQTNAYFVNLDKVLDSIYQYPDFLSGLDSDARDKTEYPTRSLLSQTAYFRPLRCIWVYNRNHAVRGCYARSGAGMYKQEGLDIYSDDHDPAAECVRDFIENESGRLHVFCCANEGDQYLRVVKRVYQDKGRREVGYIVCDLQLLALEGYARSTLTSDNQYAWIYSDNGGLCDLSNTQNANAKAYMKQSTRLQPPFSGMINGNFFCCTVQNNFGVAVCLFTDEIEMRRDIQNMVRILVPETIALLILYLLLSIVLTRKVNHRISTVTDILRRIEGGETALRLPCKERDEIGAICGRMNSMMDHMEITTAEEARLRRAFEESRYQSLQAQVNPHFLFNTLENISAIALSQDGHTVDEMCGALSAMLRYSIEDDRSDRTVSLREELEYVDQYMLIINVRMNQEINLVVNVPREMNEIRLPRLSVQPLVDNAIRHGLRFIRGQKALSIYTRRTDAGVEVIVENNGAAGDVNEMNRIIRRETTKDIEHTSIGIRNIQERVRLLFGEPYGLRAEQDGEKTRMILLLPDKER